jgi:hypothetical protein
MSLGQFYKAALFRMGIALAFERVTGCEDGIRLGIDQECSYPIVRRFRRRLLRKSQSPAHIFQVTVWLRRHCSLLLAVVQEIEVSVGVDPARNCGEATGSYRLEDSDVLEEGMGCQC